jgi:hypothetical protein
MNEDIYSITARLIKNTKTKKRIHSIPIIAKDIDNLSKRLGGLEKVSREIGISKEMLGNFLKVKKLTKEVYELVNDRKIDSVTLVKYLSKFPPSEQLFIAREIINNSLNSRELRAIYPLRLRYPNLSINEVIEKHFKSKNLKILKAFFQVPLSQNPSSLSVIFENKLGSENIISLEVKNHLGIIKITVEGEKILRKEAKDQNLNLNAYINKLLNKND